MRHRLTRVTLKTLLPSLGLIAASLLLAGPVRGGLFLADDHPTNVFHLWFARTHAGPFAADPWNPYINAGKPAYYLYPPGFALVGRGLDALTLNRLDVFTLHRLLMMLLYVAPGIAVWTVLTRLRVNGLVAFGFGLLANTITIAHGHGDVGGFLMHGMLNARLTWVLVPLVLLGLSRTFDRRGGLRATALTGLALGALALCHPWHTVVPVLVAIIWALCSTRGEDHLTPRTALGRLALVGAIALGLSAFWLLPTIEQRAFMRRGTLWQINVLPMLKYWVRQHRALLFTAALAGIGLRGLKGARRRTRDMLIVVPLLALLLTALLGVVQRAGGVPMFEARRFKDDLILGLILLGGVGVHALVRPGRGRPLRIVAAALLLFASGWRTFSIRPGVSTWTAYYTEDPPVRWFYDEVRAALHLDDLWAALRHREGRILFTAATIHAERGRGDAHLMTLAPITTGREIVNGTSTHHTPVSVFLQTGRSRGRTERLAEAHDNRHLFGLFYASRDPADRRRFLDACLALDVTDIVVHESEKRVLRFLARTPEISERAHVGPFHLFEVTTRAGSSAVLSDGRLVLPYRSPAWRSGAVPRLAEADGPRWNGSVVISVAYQRAWRLRTAAGEPVPFTESKEGLIEARPPTPCLLVLDRRRTPAPVIGRVISALTLLLALTAVVLARWRRASRLEIRLRRQRAPASIPSDILSEGMPCPSGNPTGRSSAADRSSTEPAPIRAGRTS